MSLAPQRLPAPMRRPHRPFRAAVLRGLGGFIPPLLTVVVLLWVFGTVDQYVLGPVERGTNELIARSLARYLLWPEEGEYLQNTATIQGKQYRLKQQGQDYTIVVDGTLYYLTSDNSFVTADKFLLVRRHDDEVKKYTGLGICYRFAQLAYM